MDLIIDSNNNDTLNNYLNQCSLLTNLNLEKDKINNSILKIGNCEKLVNEIDALKYYIQSITSYINSLTQLQNEKNNKNNIEKRIFLLSSLMEESEGQRILVQNQSLHNMYILKKQELESSKDVIADNINNLASSMGIEICNICNGEGFQEHNH